MSGSTKPVARAKPDKLPTSAVVISRILCVTDLSPPSSAALRYAASLAKAHQARLYIFHALNSLLPRDEGFVKKYIVDTAYESLAAFKEIDLLPIAGAGDPGEAALQAAREHKIDLIVMHSRRRPLAAALFGSTAETICHNAPCAILVVHADEHEWAEDDKKLMTPAKILVALDFSPFSLLALSYGMSLRQGYDARLYLLTILPVTLATGWIPPMEEEKKAAVHRLINTVPPTLYLEGKVEVEVREGEPSGAILDFARELDIDLICIGAHGEGKGGWSGITMLGCNADYVVRLAPCPVLVARSAY